MTILKLFWFLTCISYISSDSIRVKSPLRNQIILNSSLIIEYTIVRDNNNNRLFVNHTTTDLINSQKNLLVSYKRNITNSTLVRINVDNSLIQNNNNLTIRIIASGRRNNRTLGQFLVNIPIQIKPNVTDDVRPTITVNTESTSNQVSAPKNNGLKYGVSSIMLYYYLALFLFKIIVLY